MVARREYPLKLYIQVWTIHHADGTVVPLKFRLEHGTKTFVIDRVEDVRPAVSLKAGGRGMRYTCIVNEHEIHLFDDRGYWFVEKDQAEGLTLCESAR